MSLFTIKEINDNIAGSIGNLIKHGFRINKDKSKSDDSNVFNALLESNGYSVEICSVDSGDRLDLYTVSNLTNSDGKPISMLSSKSKTYYKVHDNIYATTKLEADNERVKWYTKCLGVNSESKNSMQEFADIDWKSVWEPTIKDNFAHI